MTRQAKLNDDTCEELLKLGKMGWTFDDVVNMLLKFYKENKWTIVCRNVHTIYISKVQAQITLFLVLP